MIIFVFGLPASGKSYFSKRLSKRLRAEYVNSDIVRRKMFSKRTYSFWEKTRVYNKMLSLITEASKESFAGKVLVVDATFYKKSIRDKFIKKAKSLDETYFFIEVKAGVESVKKRMKKKRRYSEADFEVYLQLKEEFEDMKKKHLVLYSDRQKYADRLSKALKYTGFKVI